MSRINLSLRERHTAGKPIRVALIGAGQMGTDIVAQFGEMKGIDLSIVADIDLERARKAFVVRGISADNVGVAATEAEASALYRAGRFVITADAMLAATFSEADVVIESTGSPAVGTRVALEAALAGKHLVMMSVEADVTVGPVLRQFADHHGVIYTLAAGDEPASLMELYDFADALGLRVVAAGKGKNNRLDRHAVPSDVEAEAKRRGLSPNMLIEFIDGSKTMIEMAAFGNATGMTPDIRGMHGPKTTRDELAKVFSLKSDGGILEREGVIDYGVGNVAPGVFVVVTTDSPRLKEALIQRDMGSGPNYVLFRPYHLCSIEVPLSAAVAVIEGKSMMEPKDRLVNEVFAVAKQDLEPGTELDGIGGYHYYSSVDSADLARVQKLLPLGLAKGARVSRHVKRDEPLTYENVEVPATFLARARYLQDQLTTGQIDMDAAVAALKSLVQEARH